MSGRENVFIAYHLILLNIATKIKYAFNTIQ